MLRNSRARSNRNERIPARINVAMPLDDRKKVEVFVALLAQIDRRINASGKKTSKAKLRKAKDALTGQYKKGSRSFGPIIFKQLLYYYKNIFSFTKDTHHEERLLFAVYSF